MADNLANDTFRCISLNEIFKILHQISLKYIVWVLIDNMATLVQIMAWCRTDEKPSEAILVCCANAYMRYSASVS